MIIDFSVKNFRSFQDQAVLSMHAEHPKNNLLNNITYPLDDGIAVLRSAVIYGSNASGKSNILHAMNAMKYIIGETHTFKENKKIGCYEPYMLGDSHDDPIEMEIEFSIPKGYRFVYQISYTATEIVSESLDYYPGRSKANIFTRNPGDTWETISFGGRYKGGIRKLPFFKNQSYLSVAGHNAGTPDIIRAVCNYFGTFLVLDTEYEMPVAEIYQHDAMLDLTANFLGKVDVGISGISKLENDLSRFGSFPANMPEHVKESFLNLNKYKFIFHHVNEGGHKVEFEKSEESDGTQKLFNIIPAILTTLKLGNVLVMDELENSFHPHIAEMIIALFNDPEINVNNAQLIFTTHNVELMSPTIFRRDQIWFTKKTAGASRLYSLDEFDKAVVTTSSPYGDWYADGRFGAVPELNYKDISSFVATSLDLCKEESRIRVQADEEE